MILGYNYVWHVLQIAMVVDIFINVAIMSLMYERVDYQNNNRCTKCHFSNSRMSERLILLAQLRCTS